jgi:DNA-binding PadR family transcriptional regulator
MVKKFTKKNFTHIQIAKWIMDLINEGYHLPSQMCECMKISKEKLNYHLQKMVNDGLIRNYSRGIYDLTESGKKIHLRYAEEDGKRMIRLENMRWKYPISKGGEKVIQYIRNPKRSEINGVTQYHGKINNLSSCLRISKKNSWLEITAEKQIGENNHELYCNARAQIEKVMTRLQKDKEISIEMGQPSMKPEFAIPHPFAHAGLTGNQSSQIRTQFGIINRSIGRNADWEVDSIANVERILNIPNDVEEIKNNLIKLCQIIPKLGSNYTIFL